MMAEQRLLDRLLALHWMGGVTDEHAARLVGMRRCEFVELSDLRLVMRAFDRLAWRYYLTEFNYCFPECDQRATKREHPNWRQGGGRMYTDDELLTPPQRPIGTEKQTQPPKIDVGPSPPAKPRELPRVVGQRPPFDWAA